MLSQNEFIWPASNQQDLGKVHVRYRKAETSFLEMCNTYSVSIKEVIFQTTEGKCWKGFWVNMCTFSYVHHNYSFLN